MSNIKVLFVAGSINPERGGVARVCCNLANGFKRYGITSYSISETTDSEGYFADSVCFEEPLKVSHKNREQVLFYYERYLFSFVILENPHIKWMLDAISILKGKSIIIGEFHNSPYGFYNNIGNNILFSRFYTKTWCRNFLFFLNRVKLHWYWLKVSKILDHMVLLSDAYYDELIKLAYFPRESVSVIPNPFPAVVHDNGIRRQNWLLFVGRLIGYHKGLQWLLEIWKRLSDELPTWQLMIVGGGKELPKWKEVANDLNLKNIHFEDFQSPSTYYSESKIFLMTSLFEGFPMTLVEAMQHGCVPVAYDSFAALGDIVDHQINGLTVRAFDEDAFVDSVLCLANNENLLKEFSLNAIKKSRDFEEDRVVKKWIELFDYLAPSEDAASSFPLHNKSTH